MKERRGEWLRGIWRWRGVVAVTGINEPVLCTTKVKSSRGLLGAEEMWRARSEESPRKPPGRETITLGKYNTYKYLCVYTLYVV